MFMIFDALVGADTSRGAGQMDSILMILFGCLFVTMSSLTFIEVRRIRKKLQPDK